MPVPKPNEGESQQDYVSRCIETVMNDGTTDDNKQAAAICYSTWRESKSKSLSLSALITRAERTRDGRVKWRARANSGEYDQEDERFDETFFNDLVTNFGRVQEALTRSEVPDLPVPILDIAHYSLFLPRAERARARAGYPNRLWRDGKALMAEGFFDTTPLGQLAAKAALERSTEDRRVSICVWPDYGQGQVEDTPTGRVYKGGRGVAYLDHLAMTAHPADSDTEIEVLEVKSMATMKDDAAQVLGDSEEAKKEVEQLDAARVKSETTAPPEGVVIKAEETPMEPAPEPAPPAEPTPKSGEDVSGEGAREDADEKGKSTSLETQISLVRNAWYAQFQPRGGIAAKEDMWVRDVLDDAVVVETPNDLMRYPYTRTADGAIQFSEPAPVQLAYMPASASADVNPTETIAKALRDLLPQIAEAVDKRLQAVAGLPAQLAALKAEVDALKAPTAEKVKAALDAQPDGDWLTLMIKNSVQRPSTGTVKGEGKPAEASGGEYAAMFGNPKT